MFRRPSFGKPVRGAPRGPGGSGAAVPLQWAPSVGPLEGVPGGPGPRGAGCGHRNHRLHLRLDRPLALLHRQGTLTYIALGTLTYIALGTLTYIALGTLTYIALGTLTYIALGTLT